MIELNKMIIRPCDKRKCNWLDGALAAGVNFIGGLISNHTNKKLTRETNRQNREMFNEQMQLQKDQFQQTMDYQNMDWQRNRNAALEDWYRETEYNTPAAQRDRYLQAGLNPALMMEGQNQAIGSMEASAGGSAPSPGSIPGAPQLVTAHDELGTSIAGATDAYLRARMTESEANLKDEQARQLAIDNKTRERMNLAELSERRARLQEYRDKHQLSKKEYSRINKEIDLLDDQITMNFVTFDARMKKPQMENFVTHETGRQFMFEADRLEIQKNLDALFAEDERLAKLNVDRATIASLSAQVANIRANTQLTWQQKRTEVWSTVYRRLESLGIDPNTKEGKQYYRKIASEIWHNARNQLPFGIAVGNQTLEDYANGY